jgi:hypothetical protein
VSLNLHSIVRGVINTVNPDIQGLWLQSAGNTVNANFQQAPAYAQPVKVRLQVQPPSGRDLQHINFLNLQGVFRTVYMFSDPDAIVRITAKGGDLLQFPQFAGEPNDTWLVTQVSEKWNVADGGFSRVLVTLQTDPVTTVGPAS